MREITTDIEKIKEIQEREIIRKEIIEKPGKTFDQIMVSPTKYF